MPRPLRALVVVLALAAGAALPATASAGWTLTSPFTVPATALAGDYAAAPDGSSTAAWVSSAGIGAQHAVAGGAVVPPAFSAEVARNATGDPVSLPSVAIAPNGTSAVAWIAPHVPDGYEVRVAFLDAAGAAVRQVVADVLACDDNTNVGSETTKIAVDQTGAATVVWTARDSNDDTEVSAAHVSADGSHSAPVTLGLADSFSLAVAVAPSGKAWASWIDADQTTVKVARLNAAGAIDASADTAAPEEASAVPRLVASGAGAALVWATPDAGNDPADDTAPANRYWLHGVRLPATGALTGAAFDTSKTGSALLSGITGFGTSTGYDAAIGTDGTVSVVWHEVSGSLSLSATAYLSRFAPGQASASARPLADPTSTGLAAGPHVGVAPDGSLLVTYLKTDNPLTYTFDVVARRVAPDGTLGPASQLDRVPGTGAIYFPTATPSPGLSAANATVGVANGGLLPGSAWSVAGFRFDDQGPALTIDVPATATVLAPVRFAATVSDPADAPVSWDFGDGTTGKGPLLTHVYPAAGTYVVHAGAEDGRGNQTVVTRELVITPPSSGGTPTPPPPPTMLVQPVSAGLKVTRATRKGARVTVTGTISTKATGKVTVSYAQKVGRKTTTVKKTTKIAKGRWTVTITLPKKLTRGSAAKSKGTVTATFAGTATVKKATAKRSVTPAKAKAKAKR